MPWQEGGKGHRSGEKGAPWFGCVPQPPTPSWGWQEGLAVTGVACPQRWDSCPRTGTVGGGHRAVPQPRERVAGMHRDMLQ